MIVLGIDPGLKATGYGFIEFNNNKPKLIDTGTLEPKQKDPVAQRIERIYTILDMLLKKYHPDVLVLEKLYAHHLHAGGVLRPKRHLGSPVDSAGPSAPPHPERRPS